MNTYDVIIVGGGISGLHTAFKLQQNGLKCLLLEKSKRYGGRIKSSTTSQGVIYECGASKLLPSHKNMLRLIKNLGFTNNDIVPFKKQVVYRNISGEFDITKLLPQVLVNLKQESKGNILNCTMEEWITTNYSKETSDFLMKASGYAHLFKYCNAYNGIKYIEADLLENTIISFVPGLNKIIERLYEKCVNLGVSFKKSTCIRKIESLNDHHIINDMYKANKVIFSIPPSALTKIQGLPQKIYDCCDQIVGVPLIRVFANGNLGNIPYTHIGNKIQRTMSRSEGFYQLTYASDENAKYWNKTVNTHKFSQEFCHYLNCGSSKIWNIEKHFWPTGIHLWRKGYDGNKSWKELKKLGCETNIWVIGEPYYPYQRWMESAISTSQEVIKLILR